MQARAVDLIRTAPQPAARSAPPDSVRPNADASEPKPRSRFDEELSRRTRAKDESAKPEVKKPEPAVKAKPRGDKETKPVEDAPAADDATDTGAVDADETVAESDDAPKAEKTKTKSTKKADAKKDDCSEEVPDDAAVTVDAAQLMTLPTAEPVEAESDDLAIDADAAKDEKATTDVDPDAAAGPDVDAAAQQAATPTAQKDTTTENAESIETPETTKVAATTAKPAAPQPTAGRPAATDEAADVDVPRAHGLKPTDAKAVEKDANADTETAGAFQLPPDAEKAAAASAPKKDDAAVLNAAIQPTAPHEKPAAAMPLPPTASPQPTPMRDPAEHNVDKIVTSVRGELLTKGGTMDIRLDPPSLGQVQVQITVEDGTLSANIQTTNDEATRLLSHNLAQLKTQLESAGVTVDRIQVKQATPTEQSNQSSGQNAEGDSRQQSAASQDQSARQEQQRREALQRMWARVAGNGDPLDLVA